MDELLIPCLWRLHVHLLIFEHSIAGTFPHAPASMWFVREFSYALTLSKKENRWTVKYMQLFWRTNNTGTTIWSSPEEICGLNINGVKSSQCGWVSIIGPIWLQHDGSVVQGAEHNMVPGKAERWRGCWTFKRQPHSWLPERTLSSKTLPALKATVMLLRASACAAAAVHLMDWSWWGRCCLLQSLCQGDFVWLELKAFSLHFTPMAAPHPA